MVIEIILFEFQKFILFIEGTTLIKNTSLNIRLLFKEKFRTLKNGRGSQTFLKLSEHNIVGIFSVDKIVLMRNGWLMEIFC